LPPRVATVVVLIAFAAAVGRRHAVAMLVSIPFAIALVLASLRLAPLGGGRTDIYLYPAVAVVVALALDRIRHLPALSAAAVLALGVTWAATYRTPPFYPSEDVRPLVAEVESRATEREAILIYPITSFAYALYTNWPIDFVDSDFSYTGFHVRVLRPNVFAPERQRKHPSMYGATLDRIAREYRTVWFVASFVTSHPGREVQSINRQLRERGYVPDYASERKGAELVRWRRTARG
jgi:hypothetical protein